ncbi:RNA repair transcriptional activator RtcR [Aliiglaciecola lipolytica]|uniref:Transcriptional regulatory protein RtcR n=1 Tax=Aliiglaciecola lipolytica E3 TaxID=1127673 RepID=K6YEM4_9ALTE|nr:RNA repair transcriptional activator RtcR [Aliiglaciecola lipolytica]GAC16622.1 transcriptional regulatory protein RtcR [Aliiglaciecola lipolytica E3]
MNRKNVMFANLGVVKDHKGRGAKRWQTWRPTISAVMQDDFQVDRLELFYEPSHLDLARRISADIAEVSPATDVVLVEATWNDPWDFADVYNWLYQHASHYNFDTDKEDYYLNITTGTHVNQICMFMLSEAQIYPASKLVQVSPDPNAENRAKGTISIVDLDLSKYAALAARFSEQSASAQDFLKAGIQTRNAAFNSLIEEIEQVAISATDPMLLEGPTGAGKTQLARRIYELKSSRGGVMGSLIQVNCATLVGDGAMSALFGHIKGAYTGAQSARDGYLKNADQGILFLDEIGELGLDEQAMLLHAIEEKQFYPVGSDKAVYSDFQLIAGTNLDLRQAVVQGKFREDLLARIDLWNWRLPALKERIEDFEANLDFELRQYARLNNVHIRFGSEAKKRFLQFAMSENALWTANFRDLNASVKRMATLSNEGRIGLQTVEAEILRLNKRWHGTKQTHDVVLSQFIDDEQLATLDMFDQLQLQNVIQICLSSNNLADAGRKLFNVSRQNKSSVNDSHRLRVYLQKFGLKFSQLEHE